MSEAESTAFHLRKFSMFASVRRIALIPLQGWKADWKRTLVQTNCLCWIIPVGLPVAIDGLFLTVTSSEALFYSIYRTALLRGAYTTQLCFFNHRMRPYVCRVMIRAQRCLSTQQSWPCLNTAHYTETCSDMQNWWSGWRTHRGRSTKACPGWAFLPHMHLHQTSSSSSS